MDYSTGPKDPRGIVAPLKLLSGQVAEWVTPDDLLIIGVRNSLAGLTLGFNGRGWHADGGVAELNLQIIPGSARALQFFSLPLHYGYLTSAAVSVLAGAPNRGQTLVSMQIARPPAATFATKMFLGQDYVTGQSAVLWPGGRTVGGAEGNGLPVSVSVAQPAAGVDWGQLVPTGARWLLRAIKATLATSATVGNRQPALLITDGLNNLVQDPSPLTQAASLTQTWNWVPGLPTMGVATLTVQQMALPFPIVLKAGWQVKVSTVNLSGTDQWSAVFLDVEEWIED